jgi:hypothetical protein
MWLLGAVQEERAKNLWEQSADKTPFPIAVKSASTITHCEFQQIGYPNEHLG